MLRPTATHVVPLENHKLRVQFDNGEARIFDVSPYIRGQWFSELADKQYFASVTVNGYSVEWAHGQDLCPDELYYNSVAV